MNSRRNTSSNYCTDLSYSGFISRKSRRTTSSTNSQLLSWRFFFYYFDCF